MGATLPAVARWVEATPQGVSWLGFFYGGNIAGAVFGCLLAGFYLLRVHDMATATYAAVALNVLVAATALVLAIPTPYESRVEGRGSKIEDGSGSDPRSSILDPQPARGVYLAIALSGMAALGAEVVQTDIDDPASVSKAFEGAYGAYCVTFAAA